MRQSIRSIDERVQLAAAVLHDAGALTEEPGERVELSPRELAERIAKLSRHDRRLAIRRGREVLQWSE